MNKVVSPFSNWNGIINQIQEKVIFYKNTNDISEHTFHMPEIFPMKDA